MDVRELHIEFMQVKEEVDRMREAFEERVETNHKQDLNIKDLEGKIDLLSSKIKTIEGALRSQNSRLWQIFITTLFMFATTLLNLLLQHIKV